MADLGAQSGELARALFGERDAIASGELAIDATRARTKLRKFRLPDPHLYVVQFVRAASVLGATKIEFEITTSEAECRFDSTVNSELLADIWSVALKERRSRQEIAVNHLALGLGSAQALNPDRIVVESGAAVLTLHEESDHFSEENDPVEGTRIFLKEKFRLGHLVEFFTTLLGEPAEVDALRQYCSFAATLGVTVNGESIAVRGLGALGRPMGLDVAPPHVRFEELAEYGVVKLVGETGPTRFALVRDDVLVGKVDVKPHGVTAHGVVYSPRIRTDISGLSLVRDAAVDDILVGAPMGAYHRALLAWASEDAHLSARRRLAARVFRFHHVLARAGVSPADGSNALRDWLESQELFQNAKREGFALTPPEVVVGDRIRCSSQHFSGDEFEGDGPVVLHWDPAGTGALEAWALYAGAELEDVTGRIESARMARRRKAIWENQLPIPAPDFPFQERVDVDGAKAFVYLPLRSLTSRLRSPTGLRLSVGDRPVAHFSWGLPIGIDLRGRLQPTDAHDGFVVDDTMKRLLAAVIRATPGVFEAYAEALLVADVEQPQRPRPTDAWIATLIEGDFPGKVLTLALSAEAVRPLMDEIVAEAWHEVFAIGHLLAPRDATAGNQCIELLGPIADVRSFESFDGRRFSLRTLVDVDDELLVMTDTRENRRLLVEIEQQFDGGLERRVILADRTQRAILSRMPHSQDARSVLSDFFFEEVLFESESPALDPVEEPPEREPAQTLPASTDHDPLLRQIVALLVEARGERTDLLDDHAVYTTRWAADPEATNEASRVVREVTGAGVVLQREHPLVDRVAKRPDDDGAVAFLASVVYSEINRYYETITDPDEVGFQSRLIASRIPRSDG